MVLLDVKGRMREVIVSLTNLVGARQANGMNFTIVPQSVTVLFDLHSANQYSPFESVPTSVITSSPDDMPQEQDVAVAKTWTGATYFSITVPVVVHKMIVVPF